MYVDSTSITAKGWYKKGTGYYDPWIWIGGISSIKPTDIDKKNISCDKWTKLNEVFKNHGCSTLGSCPQNLTVTNPTRYQGEPDEETERKKALDQLQAEQKKEKEELAKRIANDDDDLKPQQRSIQQPPISSPTLPDSGQLATELLSPEGSPPAPAAVPSAQPQIQLPHKVTIKLSEKPEGNPHTKEYKGSSSSDKLIKVELTSYPEKGFTQDFLKYTHSPEDNKPFKLAQVLDDRNQTVIRANGDHITSVEAYYWTGNTEKALLVGVTANSGTTYYRNSRNSTWTKHNIKSDGKPTKEELDLLNCEINGVVQIDVTNIPDYDHTETTYCHNDQDTVDKHVKKKVKVSEIPGSSKHLGNYTAYSHTPNPKTHYGINLNTFNISCFTKNDKTITLSGLHLPIMGANKVIVYFCKGEVNVIRSSGKSVNNPLLIYLPNSDQGERWFKKHYSSNEWIPVDQLNGKECFDNAVVDFLDTLESICRPPEVTINIYNRTIGNTYAYGDDFGRWITVNGGEVVGASGFIEYTHTISGSTSYFTLQNVNYTDKPTSGILDITSNKSLKYVDRVSVYYWRPLEDPARKGNPDERGRPLIIKVTAHTPGGPEKSTYYENAGTGTTDNGKWKLWTPLGFPLRPMELENKLELLNCDLNQVVSIDVNKTKGSYCGHRHNVHKKVSVSQVPDPNSQFGRYKAFEHIPNLKAYTGNSGSTHTFHISEFTSGQDKALTGLPTPLIDVSSITVYFCGKDTRSGRGTNPLLIYIDSNDPRITGNKWFQSDDRGMTWKPVDFPPSNDQTYETILDILDNVRNECQPPSVTVDIYHRDLGGHTKYYEYDSGSKRKILVMYVRDNSPGFTEYRHAIAGGIPFTVNEFRYNKPTTEGLESPMYRVTTVSVFYWTALEDTKDDQERNRPLLVKVTTIEPTSKLKKEIYYENKGIDGDLNWVPTSVDTGNLEKKLRLLNCKLNSAVIIDVGKTGNTGYYDACKEEDKKLDNGHASDRMTVNKDPTPGDQSLENYQVYKHALNNGGGKFHIVKFINGNNSRETLKGISPLPILDVDVIKVYFCSEDPTKPLLLYYKTEDTHNWYKSENPSSTTGLWVSAASKLSNTGSTDYRAIIWVLNTINSPCAPAKPTSSTSKDPKADGSQSTPTASAIVAESGLATLGIGAISGISSGTLAGSAATFFGGWKLYNRYKGDPWVRQI
ncbi:hypothetical protein BEWA_029800 [Theileria equi strain WA]|uniref:Uncharacterized protein n=1 Tax=Theileria equi strain WA TaxID=1537102 RepID=L0AZ03_THEEQ|nr:hypothetical protein BEWA_029800 [Theileria equi strain WA]AFZ80129.1 hypothetical protein BEWA_029800 [Theileria equi strain WA]|eukprot:XP_004829795.1 hypothetical protein BEWA_029800 [Theileria equi strain WA]